MMKGERAQPYHEGPFSCWSSSSTLTLPSPFASLDLPRPLRPPCGSLTSLNSKGASEAPGASIRYLCPALPCPATNPFSWPPASSSCRHLHHPRTASAPSRSLGPLVFILKPAATDRRKTTSHKQGSRPSSRSSDLPSAPDLLSQRDRPQPSKRPVSNSHLVGVDGRKGGSSTPCLCQQE